MSARQSSPTPMSFSALEVPDFWDGTHAHDADQPHRHGVAADDESGREAHHHLGVAIC